MPTRLEVDPPLSPKETLPTMDDLPDEERQQAEKLAAKLRELGIDPESL